MTDWTATRAARNAELDAERARQYGREDYWNDPRWRDMRARHVQADAWELWREEEGQRALDKFLPILREKAPELSKAKSLSIRLVYKFEAEIMTAFLSIGCSPRMVPLAFNWPLKVSHKAATEIHLLLIRAEEKYSGPENLTAPPNYKDTYRAMWGEDPPEKEGK